MLTDSGTETPAPAAWGKHSRSIWVSLFFVLVMLGGLGIYRDYGISWDEPAQHYSGIVTLKSVLVRLDKTTIFDDKQLPTIRMELDEYTDRDYGVAFETPAVFVEKLLRLEDSRDIFMLRHLLTFLVACGGIFAIFLLAERRFSDWRLGLLAALCLILSPRLFAESFYNDKDIVFMALFAIAMNTTIGFLLKPGFGTALAAALATAIAIDVRIMAIILPMVALAVMVIRVSKREISPSTALRATATYIGSAIVFVVAFWPWLWPDPWGRFTQGFANMARFRWDGHVFYMGASIPGTELPWHYIPVWIVISTPLIYSVFFLIGALGTVRRMIGRRLQLWKGDAELQDVVFLALFAGPIFAVIAFHSVLYNGWRQMYFVYPAFLLLALAGLVISWRALDSRFPAFARPLLVVLSFLSLANTAAWMVTEHPYQNVYFNVLAGKDWKSRFELDYWGLGNRRALEYILEHDGSPSINVWRGSRTPLQISLHMVEPADRARIQLVKNEPEADYIITNYQGDSTDYAASGKGHSLFYQIRIGDEIILSIYKTQRSQEMEAPAIPSVRD